MRELMGSINTLITNLIKLDLACVKVVNCYIIPLPRFNGLDVKSFHVFYTSIIAYCQYNRYVRLAIYADLLTLGIN